MPNKRTKYAKFECLSCGRKFKTAAALAIHRKVKHPETLTFDEQRSNPVVNVAESKSPASNEVIDYASMYYKSRNQADSALGKINKLEAVVYHMVHSHQHSAEAFSIYVNLSNY